METQHLIAKLASKTRDTDFLDVCEEVLGELSHHSDAEDSVEGLLRIIEENEDVDFGLPGPIVHFVERFFRRGYEAKLMQSLRRHPTFHTLWMLNRVINGVSKDEKQPMLELLNEISTSTADESIRSAATHFFGLHR